MPTRDLLVYIIESPSCADVYHNRSEGDHLQNLLKLAGIDSRYRRVPDRKHFHDAIAEMNTLASERNDTVVLLHISAHGFADGIALTNGEIADWDAIRGELAPLNEQTREHLIVCMSSCEGFSGCRMAMTLPPELPFLGIVGHTGKPTWGDTAAAFHAFYHRYAKGDGVAQAVEAMKAASGDEGFLQILAQDARVAYLRAVEQQMTLPLQPSPGPLPQISADHSVKELAA